MNEVATIPRPELTLPDAEAALVRAEYAEAEVILEYGSGGSTVMAAEMPGKRVFTVESDRAWAEMMRGWFAANPPAQGSEVNVIWSDIGRTRDWGQPVDDTEWRRYPRYPLEVWGLPEFRQPQVVLVDGRFRQGCALAAKYLAHGPVTLLFDDYLHRKHYHQVEAFLGRPEITGRMARFEITPEPIPPDRLLRIMQLMVRP
ncbi:hypothetical protein FIU97_08325 [Roseivivax sp. THAF40]|uniref:hypothetical protein n=1 Tax=unclassified Roseivivax TaxID=2639302 RepID=UPI001267F7DE|nr:MULTISPECIES: hypothetical protein [unclassified Roseivivax]QFS82804.1 hypothetical protein FIV09_08220 [Roseivivax sp. THAF197b]QFT46573.1 hypothetical protein FIU97_08325 [Roseivivax sp. THAF40]